MNRILEGNHHATRRIVQFIIGLVIGAVNYMCVLEGSKGGEEEEAQYAHADENGKHKSSGRFIDMGFPLELKVHKQVAEKHAIGRENR